MSDDEAGVIYCGSWGGVLAPEPPGSEAAACGLDAQHRWSVCGHTFKVGACRLMSSELSFLNVFLWKRETCESPVF